MTRPLASPAWGWNPEQIATWNRSAECDHAAFDLADDPRRPLEACPTCDLVLRTITDEQGWIDHAAEMKRDDERWELAVLTDYEEKGSA